MQMLIDQLGSDDLLMFSTDYPHWQFDTPEEALAAAARRSTCARILSENARFYRLHEVGDRNRLTLARQHARRRTKEA